MICPLCERDVPKVSDHHLIPKSRGGRAEDTVPICLDCHNAIHAMFTNKELEREFRSVAALLENERFGKHVRWLARQDPRKRFRSKTAKDRRHRGRGG